MEFVPVHPEGVHGPALDEELLVFTLHDGDQIPRDLWGDRTEEVLARPDVRKAYLLERDWGADRVAAHLARELGLSGYLRLNLARVVLDFGRFAGTSRAGEPYLTRHCMFPPVEHLLSEQAIHDVLARFYDATSSELTQRFASKRLTLAVHTYDTFNATGTERPELSLVTRSMDYQQQSTLPGWLFDPLFPPILGETVADRRFTYRLAFDLEQAGYATAMDYPYVMPAGSVEIRAQVWFFFRHLRRAFTRAFPETRELPGYQRLWQMLLDPARRSPEAEQLRAYLHRYRSAPAGQDELFARARQAYARIQEFLGTHRAELVDNYRNSPVRPSTLGLEVRKDKLAWIDPDRGTVEPQPNADNYARRVARVIAGSVLDYIAERDPAELETGDLPAIGDAVPGFDASAP
ncbi:MAG: hypothetical protein AAGE94_16015 [Acidobacteriota bacterium]